MFTLQIRKAASRWLGVLRRTAIAAFAVAFILSLGFFGALSAKATAFTPLALVNGWVKAPFANNDPGVGIFNGIVQFQGAISSGSAPVAFTLPPEDSPATNVYVPVDLCDATKGRLFIQPSGVVSVQAEGGNFGNAQCFTSLDGVSFAPSAVNFEELGTGTGWTGAPFGTSNPAVRILGNIVHFKGAVAFQGTLTPGTDQLVSILPDGFRPATNVYVLVDLCGATNGRLFIQPSGEVWVQAEGGNLGNAQCFTSLDGATFALPPNIIFNPTPLTLEPGWTNAPFGTSNAEVSLAPGIVQFQGAVAFQGTLTPGTDQLVSILPDGFRPATNVWVAVDLCGATNGRLFIQPSGEVWVEAEGGNLGNAQCFTSLDGAAFAP